MKKAFQIFLCFAMLAANLYMQDSRSAGGAIGRYFHLGLTDLLGTEKYEDKLIDTVAYQGEVFRVYETLTFKITAPPRWHKTLTLFAISMPAANIFVTNTRGSIVCYLYGVTAGAIALLPVADDIRNYSCQAQYCRYITVNGSQYRYNTTKQTIRYQGYDNMSVSMPAYIDADTKTVTYSDSMDYFNDYTAQIQDAYAKFQQIGQKE